MKKIVDKFWDILVSDWVFIFAYRLAVIFIITYFIYSITK